MAFSKTCLVLLLIALGTLLTSAEAQLPTPSNQAQATAAKSPDVDFAEARRLSEQGRYDEAIAQLQTLSTREPNRKGINRELGTAYYKKGDYVDAITSLKKALAEDPQDSEATQLLGLSYYLAGNPGEAIPLLEKVQTWLPRANVDASYILGVCYIQTKDYPKARAAFARMFNVPPD